MTTNLERARDVVCETKHGSHVRRVDTFSQALDEAEQRGRDNALEGVTLALDKATPLTNGVDAPSRIAWMFARIEDAEADRDSERKLTINDCIAALDDTPARLHHGFDYRTLDWAGGRLRELLAETEKGE